MKLTSWAEELARDVRYGARTLRRAPGFAAVAVATLALGIGANTAIFSVLHGVWVAEPYPAGARLLDVSMRQLTGRRFERGASYPDLMDWRAQAQSIAEFGTHKFNHWTTVTGAGEAEEVVTHLVSSNLFPLLGVAPVVGRGFTAEEDRAGGPRSALLSNGYWRSHFGGAPAAVGARISVDGEAYIVVGVMPPKFSFPPAAAVWSPAIWLSMNLPEKQTADREYRALDVVAKLKPSATLPQARAEMEAIVARLARAYPRENGDYGVKLSPLRETRQVMETLPTLRLLMAAAGFVLLIACVNVANLLLARAAGREREFAIRRALGVTRMRLARQLLAETGVLALAGGAAGALLAACTMPAVRSILPSTMPRAAEVGIDWTGLAFAAALAALTGLLFGIAPAWRVSQPASCARHTARQRTARLLVTAEVALAAVLLAGAGLFIESFRRATSVDLGFDRRHVLTMRIQLDRRAYATGERIEAFRSEMLRRARAIPSVDSAGTISTLPLGALGANTDFEVDGRAESSPWSVVSPGYFRAMRVPLVSGRYFAETESEPVVVVSQSLARRCWPGSDAVGKRVRIDEGWFTVAGIVRDVRQSRPDAKPETAIYVLSSQLPPARRTGINARFVVLVLRTAADPSGVATAMRTAVAGIDRNQAVADVKTMEERIEAVLAARRLNMRLVSIFAGLAMLLAAVGVFGVVSYAVTRRTGEIGIRMALGAQRAQVLAMIARETAALALAGVTLGAAGTMALSGVLHQFLYGVAPADPRIVTATAVGMTAMVLAAGLVPARRAVRVDPAVALRAE